MNFDLKLAILKSGKRQWKIAQEAGISESKLSKHLHGYSLLYIGQTWLVRVPAFFPKKP
jgi:hypothetical protein